MKPNLQRVTVDAPTIGLVTAAPSSLTGRQQSQYKRAITVARNVRVSRGTLRNAPGYERVVLSEDSLDSAPCLIRQANILNNDLEARTTPIIGTGGRLYTILRRSRPLICGGRVGNQTLGFIRFAWVGNTAGISQPSDLVSDLVQKLDPMFVVHSGNAIAENAGQTSKYSVYDELVGRWYWPYIGQYVGPYGRGPGQKLFFPARGYGEANAADIDAWREFYGFNGNLGYYDFKYGPCHFIMLDGEEILSHQDPTTSPQYAWARSVAENSDCPWPIVVLYNCPYTSGNMVDHGYSGLRWPFATWGVKLVLSSASPTYEEISRDGIIYAVNGLGGQWSPGAFGSPVTGSSYHYNSDYGCCLIEASTEHLSLKWHSIDEVTHDTTTEDPGDGDNIYVPPVSKTPKSLAVLPAAATVEVGKTWQFRAEVSYVDGSREDVTSTCSWSSSSTARASVAAGKAVGLGLGTASIIATFGSLTAAASFTVKAVCLDAPLDLVIVADRSDSTRSSKWPGTWLDQIKLASSVLLDSLAAGDQAALVSFAGDYANQLEDVTVNQGKTGDIALVKRKLDDLRSGGDTGVSGALLAAQREVAGTMTRAGAQKVVVVLTDGGPMNVKIGGDISDGEAAIAAAVEDAVLRADALKDDGIAVYVLGYNIPAAYESQWTAVASTNKYFNFKTADDFVLKAASLPNLICSGATPPPTTTTVVDEWTGQNPPENAQTRCIISKFFWPLTFDYNTGKYAPLEGWMEFHRTLLQNEVVDKFAHDPDFQGRSLVRYYPIGGTNPGDPEYSFFWTTNGARQYQFSAQLKLWLHDDGPDPLEGQVQDEFNGVIEVFTYVEYSGPPITALPDLPG
jgi:Mg-chelatase subunit ChlD